MALPSFILTLSLFLPSLTSALPNPLSTHQPSSSATAAAETWHIPRLAMHMMTPNTGIPGNPPWPENLQFNSTIDFDVLVPSHALSVAEGPEKWNCKGSMRNGTVMQGAVGCERDMDGIFPEGDEVAFGMTRYMGLGERRAELSFWLWVARVGRNAESGTSILQGATAITANDVQEPSSYLTCLQGRPFDGLRCEIGSYLSVRKELLVEGSTVG